MREKIQDMTVQISSDAEKKIADLMKNGGYKKLKELGFGLLKEDDGKGKIPHITELINSAESRLRKKTPDEWILDYKCIDGIKRHTRIYHMNGLDPKKPLFIFHHGFLGLNHESHLKVVTNKEIYNRFNVISIGLNGHESIFSVRDNFMNSFKNVVLSMVGSIIAIEKIINGFHKISDRETLVTGISLGGIISAWHYFTFNTADIYIPIIAHPNASQIFVNEKYREGYYDYNSITSNKSYMNCFKLNDELKDKDVTKIQPIIAKKDSTVLYNEAKKNWEGYNVYEIDAGHYSAATKRLEIIKYILKKFDEISR